MTKCLLYMAPIVLIGLVATEAPAATAAWSGSIGRNITATAPEGTGVPLVLECQRGGRGGGGGARAGGGGARAGGGGGSWAGAGRGNFSGASANRGNFSGANVNRGNVSGANVNRGNFNSANVNRGNVNTANVNRNVNRTQRQRWWLRRRLLRGRLGRRRRRCRGGCHRRRCRCQYGLSGPGIPVPVLSIPKLPELRTLSESGATAFLKVRC